MDSIFGESNRLIFRKMSYKDFHEIAQIMRGKNVREIWEYDFTDADVNIWIEKYIEFYTQYNLGYFIALEKQSNKIVGQIGLMPDTIDGNTYYEIGYILKEDFVKQGFATEGAKFMADYAFNKLKLKEVIFEIRARNIKSIAVAKRLGAIKSGSFVKNVKGKDMEHLIFTLNAYT